jgi:uncharacterized protein (DUF1501 family)
MLNRRRFLQTSSLIALAPTVPAFLRRAALAAEPQTDDRILVVIQLDGGNDGINTVVPFRDPGYAEHRARLRLADDRLIRLTDDVALHPSLQGMAGLFESSRLAIVQGVGYPNPNRSHDVSMAIWQSARFDPLEHKTFGWIGRALDQTERDRRAPASILIGDGELPQAVIGRRSIASNFTRLEDMIPQRGGPRVAEATGRNSGNLGDFVRRTTLDAYTTAELLNDVARKPDSAGRYPATELAQRLQLISGLIQAGLPTRVYYVVQSSYDTHSAQAPTHSRLLRDLGDATKSFLGDLNDCGLADRVLMLCFSEFGRRVQENASEGTDHGTSGPVFLAGPGVRSGLHGAMPSLTDLDGGDLKMSIDFRRVYAAVLEGWMAVDSRPVLDGEFSDLAVLV